MKIREIISESYLSEDENSINANLIMVLLYLKEQAENDAENATLRTDSVIQLVRNAGDMMFDYQALTAAFEQDESVKGLIKTFNKDELTLKSDIDAAEDIAADANASDEPQQSPEKTVKDMAKSAANKRA